MADGMFFGGKDKQTSLTSFGSWFVQDYDSPVHSSTTAVAKDLQILKILWSDLRREREAGWRGCGRWIAGVVDRAVAAA